MDIFDRTAVVFFIKRPPNVSFLSSPSYKDFLFLAAFTAKLIFFYILFGSLPPVFSLQSLLPEATVPSSFLYKSVHVMAPTDGTLGVHVSTTSLEKVEVHFFDKKLNLKVFSKLLCSHVLVAMTRSLLASQKSTGREPS